MQFTMLSWRLPADAMPEVGSNEAVQHILSAEHEPSHVAATLGDDGWQPVSHNVTFDVDGPVLTLVLVKR